MRLHFFPALLPLASLFPWLLGAVGTAAGFFYSRSRSLVLPGRARRAALAGIVALAIGFTGLAIYRKSWRDPSGTRLTPSGGMPTLEVAETDASAGKQPASAPATSDGPLSEIWGVVTARRALSQPSVGQDLVLIGTQEGTVDAFERATGRFKWSLKKSEPVLARPLVVPGHAAWLGEGLHETRMAALTAVSLPSGKPSWQRELPGHVEMSPLLSEDSEKLWVAAGQGGLWNLEARTGRVIWQRETGHADATPALGDGSLFVAIQPNTEKARTELQALDPDTGTPRWTAKLPGMPWGSPVVRPGIVMVTTGTGQIGRATKNDRGWAHGIDVKTGKLRWSNDLPATPLLVSPFLENDEAGLLIVTLQSGQVLALEPTRGEIVWRTQLHKQVHAPAVAARAGKRGLVLVSDAEGALHVLDATDGSETQTIEISTGATSSPEVAGDLVYVAAPGMLAAFRIR